MVTNPAHAVALNRDALVELSRIARLAGAAILKHYEPSAGGAIALKQDGSPLTAADEAAHAVISEALAEWDSSIPVISEEAELPSYEERAHWRRFWLVDPLDGTKEFISRNGEFTVNIALIENGEPVLGVVHAPALGLMYTAGKDLGAWREEADGGWTRVLHVPPVAGQPLTIVESRSHGSPEMAGFADRLNVQRRVAIGSSLKFCWVAEGRAQLYPRLGPTMEWDVAAGDCIFRNSAPVGQYSTPLVYNKPDLRNSAFVIGSTGAVSAAVLWFTGLSGSGKSTIAGHVASALRERGGRVEHLDGDTIRDIFPQTGFSRSERDAHARRVGYLASRLEQHGMTVVVSLISPYEESRRFVRALCANFIEIYVATPLAECERRDVKGLYQKARRGEITNFTGIDDPYEAPSDPDLVIDTTAVSIEQAVAMVTSRFSRKEI